MRQPRNHIQGTGCNSLVSDHSCNTGLPAGPAGPHNGG